MSHQIKKFTDDDFRFMSEAIELAKKGLGKTVPNPVVGAVLVTGGRVIGRGYHKKAGTDHAEVVAIKNAFVNNVSHNNPRKNINGSVLYVTLEPCVRFAKSAAKRTPPCSEYIIKNGIKEVVIAMRDPNKSVNGKGIRELRKAGIIVREGIMGKEARAAAEFYVKTITSDMPFVTLKMAMSIDGKIALSNGKSRWISCESSRKEVHRLRGIYDAVLTSSTTVIKDNPHLGVRMVKGRDPIRIVLDRDFKTNLNHKVYRDKNVIIVTTNVNPRKDVNSAKIESFKKRGFEILIYKKWPNLRRILFDLRRRGVYSIMVEAGATMAKSFLTEKVADKLLFFIAPKIIGGDGVNVFSDLGIKKMEKVISLENANVVKCGVDLMVSARL